MKQPWSKCNGCDLCLLPCPVWRESRDVRLTPKGRAMALKGGASAAEVKDSVDACVLCGACETVCPERIGLIDMTLGLRAALATGAAPERVRGLPSRLPVAGRIALLAGPRLAGDASSLVSLVLRLGGPSDVVVAEDAGTDIAFALEAGRPVPDDRRDDFLRALHGARSLVCDNAVLARALRRWRPATPVTGLAESVLARSFVRASLGPADFLLLDALTYHADFERLVLFYDTLRKERACSFNLDLQRCAIPLASAALAVRNHSSPVSPERQLEWILQGHSPARIICESLDDLDVVRKFSRVPAIHVGLLGSY